MKRDVCSLMILTQKAKNLGLKPAVLLRFLSTMAEESWASHGRRDWMRCWTSWRSLLCFLDPWSWLTGSSHTSSSHVSARIVLVTRVPQRQKNRMRTKNTQKTRKAQSLVRTNCLPEHRLREQVLETVQGSGPTSAVNWLFDLGQATFTFPVHPTKFVADTVG